MVIEAATTDDVATVADQWVALADDQRAYGSHLLAGANRETIRQRLMAHAVSGTLLVARDERVVGFVMFEVESGAFEQDVDRGLIHNVYVEPAARNEGVGSALLAAAEERLAAAGVDVVAIEALAGNEAAARLYRRHGYEPHRIEFERGLESDTHSNADG